MWNSNLYETLNLTDIPTLMKSLPIPKSYSHKTLIPHETLTQPTCRRSILSRLLCLFSFWASGPFVTSSNLSLEPCLWLIYQVVESFSISYFYVVFVSHLIIIFCKCHVCVRFVLCHCFSYLFTSNIILLFRN